MHQGTIAFEAFPTTFALRCGKEPLSVNLLGVPKEAGELTITGYECTVLGIPSKVQLQTISNTFPADGFTVQVVKPLPQVQVSLNRIKLEGPSLKCKDVHDEGTDVFSTISSNTYNKMQNIESEERCPITIFYGEESPFELTLTNISNLKVSQIYY